MSSFKNAFNSRAHKERSQPESRKRFGLLEKHKDYVVRAKAFHKKEETLRKLREKAAFRNPDEFYFKMIKTKTRDGVHQPESRANKYSQEELMLMKTQDISYILQKLQSEKKKIEKLTSMLHSIGEQPSSKHIYYVEDRLGMSQLLESWGPPREDIVSLMRKAMIRYNTRLGYQQENFQDLTWKEMRYHMQIGGKECGFYTIAYMKEVMEIESDDVDLTLYFKETMEPFFQQYLDKVREQLAIYFMNKEMENVTNTVG